MSGLPLLVIIAALCIWFFGTLQRFFVLHNYGKEITPADYLHATLSCSMLLIPGLCFTLIDISALYLFLSGFAFAFIISTISTFLMGILLASQIALNPLNKKLLSLYGIFLITPTTMVMITLGIYSANPFVIGAACAVASSWIGYCVSI